MCHAHDVALSVLSVRKIGEIGVTDARHDILVSMDGTTRNHRYGTRFAEGAKIV